jgi:hypothetical protein
MEEVRVGLKQPMLDRKGWVRFMVGLKQPMLPARKQEGVGCMVRLLEDRF